MLFKRSLALTSCCHYCGYAGLPSDPNDELFRENLNLDMLIRSEAIIVYQLKIMQFLMLGRLVWIPITKYKVHTININNYSMNTVQGY